MSDGVCKRVHSPAPGGTAVTVCLTSSSLAHGPDRHLCCEDSSCWVLWSHHDGRLILSTLGKAGA